jgi:hypothetical protein
MLTRSTIGSSATPRVSTLHVMIPGFDENGTEVQVILDVTWTGEGPIFRDVGKGRLKTPEVLQIFHNKTSIRDATPSGTAVIGGRPSRWSPRVMAKSGTLRRGVCSSSSTEETHK